MFSDNDLKQINEKGISIATINDQIDNFKNGFPFCDIINPAIIGEGILKIPDDNIDKFINIYNEKSQSIKTVKFVPASGAASRMFKELFSFIENNKDEISNDEIKNSSISKFFRGLKQFAFYNDLNDTNLKNHSKSIDNSLEEYGHVQIVENLLLDFGLNYGNLPKGLLKFHRYTNENRTPVEEHLVEGAHYSKSNDGSVNLHFTVSPEHKGKFLSHINKVISNYETKYNVKYNISFSEQKNSTDTIAVTPENKPFRNNDDAILFRPAGHGALIENLNDIDADVVFVKNIDNVVPDRIKENTFRYKKALSGVLLDVQEKIFDYLNKIENKEFNKSLLEEIKDFTESTLFIIHSSDFEKKNKEEKVAYFKQKLNRPIRVCGMVKNEGEPGGGPFWVKNDDQSLSLQIVESAQIDLNNSGKKEIVNQATHFNPVDLICGIKDYKGNKFNLLKYRDPKTGFISQKSKDGRDLKAQELPGLWNGAMADWNTLFVEVPIITFNPVKTINDLLRDEHL